MSRHGRFATCAAFSLRTVINSVSFSFNSCARSAWLEAICRHTGTWKSRPSRCEGLFKDVQRISFREEVKSCYCSMSRCLVIAVSRTNSAWYPARIDVGKCGPLHVQSHCTISFAVKHDAKMEFSMKISTAKTSRALLSDSSRSICRDTSQSFIPAGMLML